MGFTLVISLMCCLIFIRIKTAQANCYDTGNFTTNSTYSKNRDIVMASLASNAAANGGFYNSSVGEGSDTVYATAMCSGDDTQTGCSSCVNTTAYNILTECPLQYEAISWSGDPLCVVHYANTYIFGVLEMDPRQFVYNTGTISWDSSGFYDTWGGLMDKVKNEAIVGNSKLKYAADKANFTLTQYIYAMVQCTPDLSKSDCDKCLTQSISDYESSRYGYRGGVIYRPNCVYRWELYSFYNEVDNAPPPSPPKTPPSPHTGDGGVSAKTIAIIVGSAVLSIALVVVAGEDVTSSSDFSYLDFRTIRAATDNFSDHKELGHGGFGTVYKASDNQLARGILPNGQEVAVKRLAKNSLQGEVEFKTEVKLMSKLRHRNLVRLIGFSIEKEERVLAWRSWNEGNALNMIDPILQSGFSSEMLRCIHIGLLCVQENAADRPSMASVVVMLSSESVSLALPLKPAYFLDTTMITRRQGHGVELWQIISSTQVGLVLFCFVSLSIISIIVLRCGTESSKKKKKNISG
ncbi:hypothetical protein ACFE04_002931 [Oxalis oulophora]